MLLFVFWKFGRQGIKCQAPGIYPHTDPLQFKVAEDPCNHNGVVDEGEDTYFVLAVSALERAGISKLE